MSYVIHQWVMSHIKKNCWPHQWPTGKSHMSRMRMRMSQENWWPHHFGGGESRLGGGPVHCNMLQHAVTHCKTLQHTATHCSTLQYTAAHCNTLHKHCNTPQHTATYWWPHQWSWKESYRAIYHWWGQQFFLMCDMTHWWMTWLIYMFRHDLYTCGMMNLIMHLHVPWRDEFTPSHITCQCAMAKECYSMRHVRWQWIMSYGVATISRLLKIIGLFCRISSLLQGSFAEETYNFKEPIHHSHPIRQWEP